MAFPLWLLDGSLYPLAGMHANAGVVVCQVNVPLLGGGGGGGAGQTYAS